MMARMPPPRDRAAARAAPAHTKNSGGIRRDQAGHWDKLQFAGRAPGIRHRDSEDRTRRRQTPTQGPPVPVATSSHDLHSLALYGAIVTRAAHTVRRTVVRVARAWIAFARASVVSLGGSLYRVRTTSFTYNGVPSNKFHSGDGLQKTPRYPWKPVPLSF